MSRVSRTLAAVLAFSSACALVYLGLNRYSARRSLPTKELHRRLAQLDHMGFGTGMRAGPWIPWSRPLSSNDFAAVAAIRRMGTSAVPVLLPMLDDSRHARPILAQPGAALNPLEDAAAAASR